MAARPRRLTSYLLRRRYWAPAAALTLAVWGGVALGMRPLRDAGGVGFGASPYGLVTPLENRALDLLFQLRDARRAEVRGRGLREPITIVEVDEASIRASNVRLQKWPRDWYARLVGRAREGGARAVGLDIHLSEKGGDYADEPGEDAPPDRERVADEALAQAINDTENIVLVQKLEAGGTPAVVPLPLFAEGATAVGFADLPNDSDNNVRAAALVRPARREGEEAQFSFAAALAQLYADQPLAPDGEHSFRLGPRPLPLRNDLALQLDFRGRTPSFQRISAGHILFPERMPAAAGAGREVPGLSDDLFRDRVVIIGATNIDAPDMFYTPFYEPLALARLFDPALPDIPARTPGVELHATAVATMLFGRSLTRPSYGRQAAFVLLALVLAALPVLFMRPLVGFAGAAAAAAGVLAVSAWAFDARGLILPLASSWLGLAAFTPLGFALRYGRERAVREEKEAERAQIMDIFSRCVSQEVADELWQRRDRVELGGESRVVTCVFTDIRGFTTLTESASSSKEVVAWLNDYFSRMHRIVCFYGGHINKFIGDGLMIVFGAPVDRGPKLEARAAVLCGLKMLEEVERLNEEWAGTGRPHLAIGVGIHTGEAVCGVVGAPGRLEYTVIGDTVNLAARLESTTKEAGAPLLVSSATAELLGQDYEAEPLGDVRVKGKTESTSVFTVKQRATRSATAAVPAGN